MEGQGTPAFLLSAHAPLRPPPEVTAATAAAADEVAMTGVSSRLLVGVVAQQTKRLFRYVLFRFVFRVKMNCNQRGQRVLAAARRQGWGGGGSDGEMSVSGWCSMARSRFEIHLRLSVVLLTLYVRRKTAAVVLKSVIHRFAANKMRSVSRASQPTSCR